MTKTTLSQLFAAVAVSSLAACGGGSSSSTPAPATSTSPAPAPAATPTPAPTPAPAPAATPTPAPTPAPAPATTPAPAPAATPATVPSPTSTPTATLSSSQTEATNLATEAKAGLAAAANASAGNGVKTPFGVQTAALPSGVTATLQCSLLGAGGTGSITYDAPTALATGSTFVITYNACGFAGYAYNGTVNMVFDRYASPTDFAYTVSYQNFTVSGNGLSNQTVSGKASCSYTNGAASCYYNDGTRGWSSTMTYTNGTVNGSYAVRHGELFQLWRYRRHRHHHRCQWKQGGDHA